MEEATFCRRKVFLSCVNGCTFKVSLHNFNLDVFSNLCQLRITCKELTGYPILSANKGTIRCDPGVEKMKFDGIRGKTQYNKCQVVDVMSTIHTQSHTFPEAKGIEWRN